MDFESEIKDIIIIIMHIPTECINIISNKFIFETVSS